MELQFHPASGRGRVRTLAVGPVGELAAIGIAALAATVAWSLVITVPAMAARRVRQDAFTTVVAEARQRRAELARVAHLASALRARALDQGDLLNRVAFLYGVAPAAWPRVLNPERSWLSQAPPETVSDRLSGYLRALERAQGILGAAESAEPSRALTMPSIVPVEAGLFEPLARFGPRVSPWTGEEEFFPGVELAAPAGSAVVSPAEGTVAFTGNVRRTSGGWLWRLGNVIVVSHGPPGATVFGHLARIEVRRGQRVRRGDRIGTVGASGWALSPQLHYEFWRAERGGLRPTDPLFSALDRRPPRSFFSLEQMSATSFPGPLEPLPGIQVSVERARGAAAPGSVRRSRHRRP